MTTGILWEYAIMGIEASHHHFLFWPRFFGGDELEWFQFKGEPPKMFGKTKTLGYDVQGNPTLAATILSTLNNQRTPDIFPCRQLRIQNPGS